MDSKLTSDNIENNLTTSAETKQSAKASDKGQEAAKDSAQTTSAEGAKAESKEAKPKDEAPKEAKSKDEEEGAKVADSSAASEDARASVEASEKKEAQTTQAEEPGGQKELTPVGVEPPPVEQRVRRQAAFAPTGKRRNRYSLPTQLSSSSPVGYRTRVPLSREEVTEAMPLLSLARPSRFVPAQPVTEQEMFEESSLGILSARQSTNYRGHRQATLGPKDSKALAQLLRQLEESDQPVLDDAAYTHVIFSQPYRTAFTLLLTFIGHKPLLNLVTVPWRALRKAFYHTPDIPTIAYLQDLHIGILADAMERAAVLASGGRRKAQVHMRPFCSEEARQKNSKVLRKIEHLCGLSIRERQQGWRIALVAQVGEVPEAERIELSRPFVEKLGANLLAFRSERIQPGVNQDDKAPAAYQERQDMDVPDEFTVMAGRAAYNAFAHWTGLPRERAKELLLLERVDVLTPGGKERLRGIRKMLEDITDRVVKNIPLWADLATGRVLSRTTARGKKAFALAGQRIYIGGLSKSRVKEAQLPWELAVRAVGACSSRSALFCELMGVMELPEDCDLLAGICMMAGPVNQNDIGKAFYDYKDLLADAFPGVDPVSLLVWTCKAKTIADPIGNEEQLMNPQRKGKLVDLRPGPHEVIRLKQNGFLEPMRLRDGLRNEERAFGELHNFVLDPHGEPIPGNEGTRWPAELSSEKLWT